MVGAGKGNSSTGRLALAAYLRVYEPIEGFRHYPPREREALQAGLLRPPARADGAADHAPDSAADHAAAEHAAALRALTALPPRLVAEVDLGVAAQDAGAPGGAARPRPPLLVLDPPAPDGEPRICPSDLGWRSLLAVQQLLRGVPDGLLPALLPPGVLAEVQRALDEINRRRPAGAPHVLTSAWHIPISWFTVFQTGHRCPADRPDVGHLDLRGGGASAGAQLREAQGRHEEEGGAAPETGSDTDPDAREGVESVEAVDSVEGIEASVGDRTARRLRFHAPMADARRNLARALSVARRVGSRTGSRVVSELLAASELEELGRWLEEFHARSVVELDYAGLQNVITPDLLRDDSVEIVSRCIRKMRARDENDANDAVAELASLRRSWDVVRSLEHAS